MERIDKSPLVRLARMTASKIVLPGFEGLDVLFVTRFFVRGLSDGTLALRASAISFQVIMAFFPTIILLFSLIPYVSVGFQDVLLQYIEDFLPLQVYDLLGPTIEDLIQNKRTGVLSLTFVLVLYYSSRSISSILAAFSQSVNLVTRHNVVFQFLTSLLIMIGFTLLIITALALITAAEWLAGYLSSLDIIGTEIQRFFFFVLNYAIVLMLFMVAISILYNVGNRDYRGWRVISVGTTMASLSMILISLGFATYITEFTSFDELYGTVGSVIGTVIIFCLWLYFNSMVLLIGFELNASITRARLHRSTVEEEAHLLYTGEDLEST